MGSILFQCLRPKKVQKTSAKGFVLWGLVLRVGLGFGLCAIGLLTLLKTVNPFRCCPPLWNYGSAVMYGRLYEVGNSLRLLFNCGCSMVQITFRWKIVRQRISQTQNQIFMVLNRIFLQENHMHVKFWCERKTKNSPSHLRLWISWRGTPPILRLISDYAAEAHLQEPEQRRFQFGIFLFSS